MINKICILYAIFITPLILWAINEDVGYVPISDVLNDMAELVKNFRGMSVIAIAAASLTLLVKLLSTELLGNFFEKFNPLMKRIIITVLGQAAGIVMGISGGLSWLDAVIAGLLTSGGAVAIYEAIKPVFVKKS